MSIVWEEDTARRLCETLCLDEEDHANERIMMLNALGDILEGYQTFVVEADERPTVLQQMEELDTLRASVEATHARLAHLSDLVRLRITQAGMETPQDSKPEERIPSHNYAQALKDAEHSLFLLTLAVPRAHDNLYWTTHRIVGRPRKSVTLLLRKLREVFDTYNHLPYYDEALYRSSCVTFVHHALKSFPHIELPQRLHRALFSD